jgi:hypothetical protein
MVCLSLHCELGTDFHHPVHQDHSHCPCNLWLVFFHIKRIRKIEIFSFQQEHYSFLIKNIVDWVNFIILNFQIFLYYLWRLDLLSDNLISFQTEERTPNVYLINLLFYLLDWVFFFWDCFIIFFI